MDVIDVSWLRRVRWGWNRETDGAEVGGDRKKRRKKRQQTKIKAIMPHTIR